MLPAQQAAAVDAASRPQDRAFFEGWNKPKRVPDLAMAAQLMGKPLGRAPSMSSHSVCP